jgi:DAK2 domain fusion protein YloV
MQVSAVQVRQWVVAAVGTVDRNRAAIDDINVFPVADRDTGANLLYTLRAGLDALGRNAYDEASDVLRAVATGTLSGARGNSGVLLSQVFRAFAESSADNCLDLHRAFCRAHQLAMAAVSDPEPGTILSVLEAIAQSLAEVGEDLHVKTMTESAHAALARTPQQLGVLAVAGVVDAGAQGLVLVLDQLAQVLTGQVVEREVFSEPVIRAAADLVVQRESGSLEYAYEVMYLLTALPDSDTAMTTLRSCLQRLGDCVVLAHDGDSSVSVHVHCNDVGAAIEVGLDHGRPRRVTVTRFADQVVHRSGRFEAETAVLVLTEGQGLAAACRANGAHALSLGRQSLTEPELTAVLTGTKAAHLTILTDRADLSAVVAASADTVRAAGQKVTVIPTAGAVQNLAALAVHDQSRPSRDDVVAMAEAAAATRRGSLIQATEPALTWIGTCQSGDVLGLVNGEVIQIHPGTEMVRAAANLVDALLTSDKELITILIGADAPPDLVDGIVTYLDQSHPEIECAVHDSGHHSSLLSFGVE